MWARANFAVRAAIFSVALCGAMAARSGAVEVRAFGDDMVACWQTEDGLPQNSVLSIAQTPDGYLWLATFDGLARFDGVRFTVFDTSNLPGLPSNRLVRLFVDRAGVLWLVTETYELARLADGRCRQLGSADGVPECGVVRVGEDGQGRLWMADTEGSLHRWEGRRFVRMLAPGGFAEGHVSLIFSDSEGTVWFRQGDRLARFQDGQFVVLSQPHTNQPASVAFASPCHEGGLWVITPGVLRRLPRGQGTEETWPAAPFNSYLYGVAEDFSGNLWVATYDNGLFRFHPAQGWQHLTVASGLTTLSLRSVLCDREGNVWVGTDGGGLLRIRPRSWKMLTRRDGLGIDAVQSLCQDQQGRIWFVGGTTSPYWLDRGVVSVAIPPPQAEVLGSVWAVLAARDGAMWIGAYGGKVSRYRDGVVTCYGPAEGMLAGSVRALLEDRHGAIWVGGFDGLSRIEHGQVTHYSQREGLSCGRVWALAEGTPGCLYVGTDGGGLNVFRDGRFTVYTRRSGLPDDCVRALYVDADGVLWIGTRAGGLSRFQDGRFFDYRAKGGLPVHSIGPMVEDDHGSLWMVANLGILRVSRRELNEFAAGARQSVNFVACDRSDGLATIEVGGIQPACLKARDGTLWFGTIQGAAFVNPAALRSNPRPPPVIIEEVRIDDEPVEEPGVPAAGRASQEGPAAAGSLSVARPPSPITLRAQQRRLEFRFTALSFAAPAKVQFRYRMEGFDPDWVDVGTARTASYTRLPPGRYRFRVTARDNDSLWNETGAARAVIVLAPWYRTVWALGLEILSGAGLLAWFYERRLRRLRRLRALHEGFSRQLIASQEAQHRRLAGELHDGLGQDLMLIKNRAVLALNVPEASPAVLGQVEEISAAATRAIEAARNMAHALRPYELDRLGLAGAVQAMIDRIADATGLEFHYQCDELADVLSADQKTALYRILQESLNNVVKHARAHEVFLEICRAPDRLTVRLQDDGCGFELDAAGRAKASEGHGLPGIYERARLVGARARIQSAPGCGTVLTLELPLRGRPDRPQEK